MKLRTALTQYSFDTLCQLARDVGIDPEGSNKTILADALCRVLPDPDHVAKTPQFPIARTAHNGTDPCRRRGELLEAEAVEKFANGFLPRLHAQLSDLTGLVFRDAHTLGDSDVLIGIPESLLKSIPIPDADQGRLLVILKPVSVGLLRAFADQIGLNLSDTRKIIVSNAIKDALLDIKTLHAYLNTLSEDRRAILDLFLPGNAITRREIADKLGESAVRELEDMLWKMPIFYAPNRDLHALTLRYASLQTCALPYPKSPNPRADSSKAASKPSSNRRHHTRRDTRKYRLSHPRPDHIARHYCTTLAPQTQTRRHIQKRFARREQILPHPGRSGLYRISHALCRNNGTDKPPGRCLAHRLGCRHSDGEHHRHTQGVL